MHRSPLIISAVFFLASTVNAEEVTHSVTSSDKVKGSAVNSSAFNIRAYPNYPSDLELSENKSKVHSSGLVVDYYPFDASGFRVSAGTYGPDKNGITDTYSSVGNKTYLGVGWKKLLNDAESLDVSVELGAFFGEETAAESTSGNRNTESDSADFSDGFDALESAVKTVKPVISLGIHYRF